MPNQTVEWPTLGSPLLGSEEGQRRRTTAAGPQVTPFFTPQPRTPQQTHQTALTANPFFGAPASPVSLTGRGTPAALTGGDPFSGGDVPGGTNGGQYNFPPMGPLNVPGLPPAPPPASPPASTAPPEQPGPQMPPGPFDAPPDQSLDPDTGLPYPPQPAAAPPAPDALPPANPPADSPAPPPYFGWTDEALAAEHAANPLWEDDAWARGYDPATSTNPDADAARHQAISQRQIRTAGERDMWSQFGDYQRGLERDQQEANTRRQAQPTSWEQAYWGTDATGNIEGNWRNSGTDPFAQFSYKAPEQDVPLEDLPGQHGGSNVFDLNRASTYETLGLRTDGRGNVFDIKTGRRLNRSEYEPILRASGRRVQGTLHA